jgi:8-oxo-dGDP phosphatase
MYVLCIVVNQEGHYLLIKEAKKECRNTWFFPAGKIEKNESIFQAGFRETREEAGIDIQAEGIFCIDHVPGDNWIRFAILARPVGGGLKRTPDNHSLEAGWFSPGAIQSIPLRASCVQEYIYKHRSRDYTLLPAGSYRVYSA